VRGTHPAISKLLRSAQQQGATVTHTGSGHFRVHTEQGDVFVSVTPKNGDAAAKRARADLRRKGVHV
jgi:hypothetical protein